MGSRRTLADFSNEDIKNLFVQELDWELERWELVAFKRWMSGRRGPGRAAEWPYNYFLWLVERVHEFGREKGINAD